MARIGVCTNAVRHSVIPPPAHGRCASRLVVVLARVPRAVDASSRGGPQLPHSPWARWCMARYTYSAEREANAT